MTEPPAPRNIKKTPRRRKAPWHLYVARCSDGTLYTGIAKDVAARLEAHNMGKGAKYTRTRTPLTLLFQEPQADYSVALKREYQVKRLGRKGKEAFINGKKLARPRKTAKMCFQKKRAKKKRRSHCRPKQTQVNRQDAKFAKKNFCG